ncbi:hypothetical protein, variant 4 [Sphaeroforma arctica JP610]|uniref:ABC transporter domain-containing protein n=1 Tax=Sphaeroforma arctica JP610 TaxID=667725 RepID=A0A0L0FY68_9EUKA|nr:hypothetical protein, variant 4 [Sphaeroforma arctica JP610]KNC81511.1 hypothetical protein, variant 4 [Sphaeroforma arctica JP610]|eukprot:XP_014155413.1 hypothetical protein, variant 4 [Sphaeroforma arctica JP610]
MGLRARRRASVEIKQCLLPESVAFVYNSVTHMDGLAPVSVVACAGCCLHRCGSLSLALIPGYYEMLVPGYLYTTLIEDDLQGFIHRCLQLLGLVILITVLKTLRSFTTSWLANSWRISITNEIHGLYMSDLTFHTLRMEYARIDNPDQRIVTDIKELTSTFFTILGGVGAGGAYEAFGNILWYSVQVGQRCGWYGVVTGYVWSAVMALISVAFINVVAPWVFRQERLEAVFRFLHVTLRTRAEDIAFQGHGTHEYETLDTSLVRCVDNTKQIIYRQIYLNVIQFWYGYMTTFVMYFSVGVAVFSGLAWEYTAEGERAQWIAQTSGSFMFLLWGFTILIQLSTQTSDFVAYVTRVSELHDALLDSKRRNGHDTHPNTNTALNESQMFIDNPQTLVVDKLQITSPAAEVLMSGLSFTLAKGDSLLLLASSGKGKSSLLRVLRGLWPASQGSVSLPAKLSTGTGGLFFLPQRAYLAHELTLKQHVMYPTMQADDAASDDTIRALLCEFGLERVLERVGGLDVIANWHTMLSVGEQQRLCLARVVWHQPSIAILDEATSSLDAEWEKRVYQSFVKRNIGVLSVGHRETLCALHNRVIKLA